MLLRALCRGYVDVIVAKCADLHQDPDAGPILEATLEGKAEPKNVRPHQLVDSKCHAAGLNVGHACRSFFSLVKLCLLSGRGG